jgi:sialidase-1
MRKFGHLINGKLATVLLLSAIIAFSATRAVTKPKAPGKEAPKTAAGLPCEGTLEPFMVDAKLEMQQVFKGGRFPNIVTAVDGTLLAVWNGVKVRRSEDAGKTWGPEILIAKGFMGGGVTVNETNGEIFAFVEEGHPPAAIKIYKSKDNGKTWSLAKATIKPDSKGNAPSMHMNEHGITLRHGKHAGRIIRPSRYYAGKNHKSSWPMHYTNAIYSDDAGKTWLTSEPFPALGTGEATLAELSNGTIYYNSRRHWAQQGADPRRRWTATSTDGGVTWEKLIFCKTLPDGPQNTNYGCMGGLVRLPIAGKDILIYSNCDSPGGRHHMTVWASFDGGRSWPIKRLVFEGRGAYSSINAGRPKTKSEGWIFLNFEGGPKGGSTVARFNLNWVLKGKKVENRKLPNWLEK